MAKGAGSVLAADFGSVQTRVVLLDVVDGEYRLVGRGAGITSAGYPINDVSVGLQRIISQMAQIGQRRLLDDSGQVITPEDNQRRGVDYFLTTASLGRPMTAVMVGLVPDMSLLSGLRAISGAYIEPVAEIHLRDEASEEERLNKVVLNQPDLVFISGGTDSGAETALLELLDTVRLGVHLIERARRPAVVYAGNPALTERVEAMFSGVTPLLLMAENVLPRVNNEALESVQQELGKVYDDYRERQSEGFAEVRDTSTSGILPTAQSYGLLADYLMQSRGGNVLAVDIGSTSSVLVGAFNGDVTTRISTTRGVGHSAQTLYDDIGADAIQAWLPFYPVRGELVNYALNRSLRPAAIPMSVRDLYLEQAFMRAALLQQVQEIRPSLRGVRPADPLQVDIILAGGAPLTGSGHPLLNLLLLADCLQPAGITEVKTDPNGLIPAMGTLARYSPEAVVQLLDGDNLTHPGSIISFEGTPEFNQPVAEMTITTPDNEEFTHTLDGGHVWSLPLSGDATLHFDIRCKGGMRLGGKRRQKITLRGGSGGLLFDARGRAVQPGETPAIRAERLPMWIREATDSAIDHVIPDEWLTEPDAPEPIDDIPTAEETVSEPKRGGFFGLFGGGDDKKATPADDDISEEQMDDFFSMADDWADDPDNTDDSQKEEVDDPAGDFRNML